MGWFYMDLFFLISAEAYTNNFISIMPFILLKWRVTCFLLFKLMLLFNCVNTLVFIKAFNCFRIKFVSMRIKLNLSRMCQFRFYNMRRYLLLLLVTLLRRLLLPFLFCFLLPPFRFLRKDPGLLTALKERFAVSWELILMFRPIFNGVF